MDETTISKGHLMTAQSIVEAYFRDAVSGQRLVSPKWVKANCPNRVQVSYNRVFWYRHDVERWLKGMRGAA